MIIRCIVSFAVIVVLTVAMASVALAIDVSGPETVRLGERITITVTGEGKESSGVVTTEGLRIDQVSGGLSDSDIVLFLEELEENGGMTAVYECTVTAEAGENVAFRVTDVTVLVGDEFHPGTNGSWEATAAFASQTATAPATEQPSNNPTMEPSAADPSAEPTLVPLDNYEITVSGPECVENGEVIDICVEAAGTGASGAVAVRGLEIISVSGDMSDADSLLLLDSFGDMQATYQCLVTAEDGETVSFGIEDALVSDGSKDYPASCTPWSVRVGLIAATSVPTGTSTAIEIKGTAAPGPRSMVSRTVPKTGDSGEILWLEVIAGTALIGMAVAARRRLSEMNRLES